MTGPRHYEEIRRRLENAAFPGVIAPYDEAMGGWYAAADVAVTRAGALTLSELAAWGLPAVLVPLEVAGGGHQRANAEWFADRGAATLLPEGELEGMSRVIAEVVGDPKAYARKCEKMQKLGRRSAAITVAETLMKYASC
jgi:UDP-N-acetylglucosamine--N-acetylmuramyl-(pentapeptide) pyrophosphoryl-undecaprenol N-acetylglucosamine transferase